MKIKNRILRIVSVFLLLCLVFQSGLQVYAAGSSIHLADTNWIKKIDVGKLNPVTGKWETATTFSNGDTVRIQIGYSIPQNALAQYDTELVY